MSAPLGGDEQRTRFGIARDLDDAKREGLEPVTWLGVVKGPKGVSNARIKGTGFNFADPVGTREGEDLLAR